MSGSIDPNLALAEFPDFDDYHEIELTDKTADFIVRKLLEQNCCAGSFTVGAKTAYNICFTVLCTARTIELPEGLKPIMKMKSIQTNWSGGHGQLLVSIERVGAWAFNIEIDSHVGYVEEKFRTNFGEEVEENLTNFFNTIKKKFLKAKKV